MDTATDKSPSPDYEVLNQDLIICPSAGDPFSSLAPHDWLLDPKYICWQEELMLHTFFNFEFRAVIKSFQGSKLCFFYCAAVNRNIENYSMTITSLYLYEEGSS